ncbi:MAG: hypothetical protein KGL39_16590 [Patescibacteria group bacterium]|nr:hypothetical protein [Patescibacteria group bacterium]
MESLLSLEDRPDAFMYVDIAKVHSQPDGSVIVFGKPTSEALDVDGQVADREWFSQALPDWFKWGNIREMHQPKAVGTGTSLEWDEAGDPWLTSKIIDIEAARKVREGVYKGYSIGIKKPVLRRDRTAPKGRFVGGQILEVSIVDRPANPESKIEIVKRVGADEWLDCQTNFVMKSIPTGDMVTHDGEFDSQGNPILQPGHLKYNEAEITIVSVDSSEVTVAMGDHRFAFPYVVNDQGMMEFGDPRELPNEDPNPSPGAVEPNSPSKLHSADGEVGIDVSVGKVNKAAQAAAEKTAFCPKCQKAVKIGDMISETDGAGGKHRVYQGDCGHPIRRFKRDSSDKTEDSDDKAMDEPSATKKGSGDSMPTSVDDQKLGGETPPPAKVKSDDKPDEMKSDDKDDKDDKADKADKGAGQKPANDEPEFKFAQTIQSMVAEAIKSTLPEALGLILPDAIKAGRKIKGKRLTKLKEHHQKLGDLIQELDRDPEANKAGAPDQNDGGPAPVGYPGDIHEQIREHCSAMEELAREIAKSEGVLIHEGAKDGNLGQGDHIPPHDLPGKTDLDLTRGNGGQAPSGAGSDMADLVKAVSVEVNKAVGSVTSTLADQVKTSISEIMSGFDHRLSVMEHQPAPARPPLVADRPSGFGESTPTVNKMVETYRQQFRDLSPREQDNLAARLIQAARTRS